MVPRIWHVAQWAERQAGSHPVGVCEFESRRVSYSSSSDDYVAALWSGGQHVGCRPPRGSTVARVTSETRVMGQVSGSTPGSQGLGVGFDSP